MPLELTAPLHTWQFSLNNVVMAQAMDEYTSTRFLYQLKVALTTFAQNPWTVMSSSDSVSVANSDLWTAPEKAVTVQASGPHGWIVLRHPSGFYLCIDLIHGTHMRANILVSMNNFTGGTISARPVAVGEALLIDLSSPGTGYVLSWRGGASVDHVFHVIHRADGLFTYFVVGSPGLYVSSIGAFGRLDDGVFANPLVSMWHSGQNTGIPLDHVTRTHMTYTGTGANSTHPLKRRLLNAPVNGVIPLYPLHIRNSNNIEGASHVLYDAAGVTNNFLSSEEAWDAWYESQTAGESGIIGRLPDAKFVRPRFANYGDHLLVGGQKHYAVYSNAIALPWDPNVVQIGL